MAYDSTTAIWQNHTTRGAAAAAHQQRGPTQLPESLCSPGVHTVVITLHTACTTVCTPGEHRDGVKRDDDCVYAGRAQRFGQLSWTSLLASGGGGSPGCDCVVLALTTALHGFCFNYGLYTPAMCVHSSSSSLHARHSAASAIQSRALLSNLRWLGVRPCLPDLSNYPPRRCPGFTTMSHHSQSSCSTWVSTRHGYRSPGSSCCWRDSKAGSRRATRSRFRKCAFSAAPCSSGEQRHAAR